MSHACDAIYARVPDWAAAGSISLRDARFLFNRVVGARSKTVVEIGSAAGVSAGILCHALAAAHQSGTIGADYRVLSYDMRGIFHRDPTKQTGSAVHLMLDPELVDHIEFRHPATAITLREHHASDEIGMLFIDADHRHPWPALDLLATLGLLRPRAEVMIHDINLPLIAPEFNVWGAKYLFDDLDLEKHGDPASHPPNTGSVMVPEDKADLHQQLVEIVEAHEWETNPPEALAAELLNPEPESHRSEAVLRSSGDLGGEGAVNMRHSCEVVHARRPEWARAGSVSVDDAQFLFARVIVARVETVVELGTASGVSTAILCHALDTAHRTGKISSGYRVLSYDQRDTFYLDPSRAVGDAAREMLDPVLVSHIEFRHPATAITLREHHAPGEIGMLFIDANHSHPWPVLDLLATLELLRPGAEVIFHDINLPLVSPEFNVWGAKHLFDDLDVKKHAALMPDPPNIGSVIIPVDKASLREQLLAIVHAHEWEADVPEGVTAALL